MPSATAQQHDRQQAIARLLGEHAITRQTELVELLRAQGFPATQSSVSRDLRDLGVLKLPHGYKLPGETTKDDADAMRQVAELVRSIHRAGPNMLILSTATGGAQRVAVTVDRTHWPEIVGTLSGDDTIFIATANATQQRRLGTRLRRNFKKATIS